MSSSQTEKQPGSPATSHQSSQESSKPASSSVTRSRSISPEGPRPPLPPRNRNISLLSIRPPNLSHPSSPALSPNETLQGEATTALSKTEDVYAQNTGPSQLASQHGSDTGDSMSIRSSRPGHDTRGEITSIFGDTLGAVPEAAAQGQQSDDADGPGEWIAPDRQFDLREELEDIGELTAGGDNEEYLLEKWKAKQKHFLILSAAGKPIYSRHGDVGLISGYVGIIQTIISFYQDSKDTLKSFAAGGANFAIITRGPLYLVAISKLLESNAQLQSQLEALYMQILSTLTLPALTHLFSVRPSTDLRRPLQGTDSLLDSLADSFTRGSPSTLLSALECLRLRKSQRQVINNTLMKSKVDSLLYGLIVTGGRLVSVIRPKKHSLHPSDLQLVFNMLFEAGAVKNGGGENWIPICLPGFNSRGYLHMYVGFLGLEEGNEEELEAAIRNDEAVAILLISADKESFFELRKMKDTVVEVSILLFFNDNLGGLHVSSSNYERTAA